MSRRRAARRAEWRRDVEAKALSLAGLQQVVNAAPEAWGRKHIIMACREAHAITGEDATLLLQANQLETA